MYNARVMDIFLSFLLLAKQNSNFKQDIVCQLGLVFIGLTQIVIYLSCKNIKELCDCIQRGNNFPLFVSSEMMIKYVQDIFSKEIFFTII